MFLIYDALRVAGYYAKLAPPELLSCSEMSASAGRPRVTFYPLVASVGNHLSALP